MWSQPSYWTVVVLVFLGLYLLRTCLLKFTDLESTRISLFWLACGLCWPLIAVVSPAEGTEIGGWFTIWVATPIGVLAVPVVSFTIELIRRSGASGRWRLPWEGFFVPVCSWVCVTVCWFGML